MRVLITFGLAVLLTCLSCGPPKPAAEEAASCRPYDLNVSTGDGAVTVAWKVDCPRLISGYNIYIADARLISEYKILIADEGVRSNPPFGGPFNTSVYPGDTNPDDSVVSYEASGLENGMRFVVTVRTVFADQTMSQYAETRMAVCGARGEILLDSRYSAEHDGFSFATGGYVRADDPTNDLYFYSKDGVHYLASPDRLDGFVRRSLFAKLPPQTDLESLLIADHSTSVRPSQDRLLVREDDVVWVLTDDGYQAQVKIGQINVGDGESTIELSYQYYPLRVL